MSFKELQGLNKDFDEFMQHIDRALCRLEKLEINDEKDPIVYRRAQEAYETLYGIR